MPHWERTIIPDRITQTTVLIPNESETLDYDSLIRYAKTHSLWQSVDKIGKHVTFLTGSTGTYKSGGKDHNWKFFVGLEIKGHILWVQTLTESNCRNEIFILLKYFQKRFGNEFDFEPTNAILKL